LFVFLLMMSSGCRRQESASERLRTLAPRTPRPIEARLSGFDWQAMRLPRATPSGLLDPARLELAGAASTVIQSLANDSSAHSRHEAGAAYLLIEHDRDAVDALESAVLQEPREAACWNDLSAARYTLAVREKRPQELPEALADADHALKLKAGYPDALFNRALIVEALGITEAARRAWQRYMETDPSTHWSTEAASHLGRLSVVTTRDVFQHQLDLASRALRAGNDGPIVALARNFPQEARTWSEVLLLAKWADAVRGGNTKTASEALSVVRKLGTAVAEFNHDQSVADAVAAIDRAALDRSRLRMLADAHAAYRDGRFLYSKRRVAEAEAPLRHARDLFELGGSPMALAADYYLANRLYDTNRPDEASRAFDDVAARFDHNRYAGLFAEIGWGQSLCQSSVGEWDTAIRTASESRKIFSSLGETPNRGEMDLLLASNLNHASQPAAAWRARIAAFPVLSSAGATDRIRNSIVTGLNAEVEKGRFEAALALAGIALEDLRFNREPSVVATAESSRAIALEKLGDTPDARRAIGRARQSSNAIPDTDIQRRTSASIDVAEAIVERNANPDVSLHLLDTAVTFYRSGHGNAWLPKAYLERGRTHASAKDDAAAQADFEAGLREVDTQRSSIADRQLRETFYDTEPELFSETIAILLRRGNTEHAFELSDIARARSVYEVLGREEKPTIAVTAAQLREAMPPRTILVEYALLRESIAIFYFTSSHSGVVSIASSQLTLRSMVERFTDLLQHRGDVVAAQQQGAALYRLLIEPVAAELAGFERLIIVPDRELHAIPFAALYDSAREHYLLEDFLISVAPNASAMLQARPPLSLEPVLVVGDPHDEAASSLPESANEAKSIAAMYKSSTLLEGDRATRARFIAAAQHSGLIHYSGHAESDLADPFGALHLVADSPHSVGDLNASEIAALHLDRSPLVVLAACGTMRGDAEHVEGMPSIARAFLAAGARSVIGTLWEVDDNAVAPLFRRVHRELRNGESASAALRLAQIALVHDSEPGVRHPSTWAPVELLGYSNKQPAAMKRSE
jgi:CHAT domain-containing protein